MENTPIKAAFVSTNSITQGEQVEPLWGYLNKLHVEIIFAYLTFVWNSEATDQAHVHCVIIGFTRQPSSEDRRLFYPDGRTIIAGHINGYLIDGPDVFIKARGCFLPPGFPKMTQGNKPCDDGNLLLGEEDAHELSTKYPSLEPYIRPFVGSSELLKGKKRYCLWLQDAGEDVLAIPEVEDRLNKCREFRSKSNTPAFRKAADSPQEFAEIRQPDERYIAFPQTSSGRRLYIPADLLDARNIASNGILVLPKAGLYQLGILLSRAHNLWIAIAAGKMKSDYQCSAGTVCNAYPWPTPTTEQKEAIEQATRLVLDARAGHPSKSLADLYDPDKMPSDLRAAHKTLDKAVEDAYGVGFNGDEERIVAHLFKLYADRI